MLIVWRHFFESEVGLGPFGLFEPARNRMCWGDFFFFFSCIEFHPRLQHSVLWLAQERLC